MTSTVGAHVAHVDGVLAAGKALFPVSASAGRVGAGGGPAVVAAPPGAQLSSGAGGAGDDYQRHWDGLGALDDQTNRAADEATAAGQQGRAGASAVRQSARAQAAALAPATASPAGDKLLVSTMDAHLGAMQHHIDATKAHNALVAGRLDGLANGYRTTAPGLPPIGRSRTHTARRSLARATAPQSGHGTTRAMVSTNNLQLTAGIRGGQHTEPVQPKQRSTNRTGNLCFQPGAPRQSV